jgi:hypothetical protein
MMKSDDPALDAYQEQIRYSNKSEKLQYQVFNVILKSSRNTLLINCPYTSRRWTNEVHHKSDFARAALDNLWDVDSSTYFACTSSKLVEKRQRVAPVSKPGYTLFIIVALSYYYGSWKRVLITCNIYSLVDIFSYNRLFKKFKPYTTASTGYLVCNLVELILCTTPIKRVLVYSSVAFT